MFTQNYLYPMYIPTDKDQPPPWEILPKLFAAYEAARAARAGSSHVSTSFETFIPSINAFASICVPADPTALAAYGIPDVDAGTLARATVAGQTDTIAMEIIRWYREGDKLNPFNVVVEEHDGLTLFNELDLQAQNQGAADFADLFATNLAAATTIVADMMAGTLTPIDPNSGSSAAMQFQGVLGNFLVQQAYYNNFPEHILRNVLLGYGSGDPVFTDPANQIAAPNNRPPGFGGTATFVSGADYATWPFPARKGLEDQYNLSFVRWQDPGSEAAFAALVASYASGSVLGTG